jgi:chromosomal replication initiator protein
MKEIWKNVKAVVKKEIPAHSFRMWIEPVEFLSGDGKTIVLSCPNFFAKKRVMDHYGTMIEALLERHAGRRCKINIEIASKQTAARQRSLEPNELRVEPQLELPAMPQPPSSGRLLRKTFTFDRFVVGNNNNFAYSAALSLASRHGLNHNSLFLMSQTGLGKSHLSQAIGHHILSHFPTENVYYITAEDFTNEMIRAFRNDAIEQFKLKYRNQCDVLLLEDVHFLTGKERTQMELAQALDYLIDADKKIIFTSCHLPAEIPNMSEQLKSRLARSLISHIETPDFQTRIKILKKKMAEHGCLLPPKVTEYLAGELSENVRQLESGLIGVAAKSSLLGEPIDLRLAESIVRNITQQKQAITVEYIKKLVCKQFNISIQEIVSPSRKRAIVRPRQVAIYLARKYTDQPLQAIGKSFNRYHGTAVHSIAAVEKGIRSDGTLKKQLELLCERIESH